MLLDDLRSAQRILVVRLDNIGDVIMLSPATRALHEYMPGAKITLLASPAGSQAGPMLPGVAEVMVWRALWQDISGSIGLDPERELGLARRLAEDRYDAAFIFTSFSQSPYPPAYICYLAGIPVRVGQSKEFGGGVLSLEVKPPGDGEHQVDRNLHLLEAAGLPPASRSLQLNLPAEAVENAGHLLQKAGLDPQAPYLLVAPGASCQARRYPPAEFARLVWMLPEETGLPVVVVGSERERDTLAPVLAAVEQADPRGAISLVGQTSVPELAALISRAALVVANNSASLHMADAFRRPMVILYSGAELESQWEPRVAPHRLLRRATHCSPCHKFTCPYNLECLDFTPQEVVSAVEDLLSQAIRPVAEAAPTLPVA